MSSAPVPVFRRRRRAVGGPAWTPLNMGGGLTLGAWYSGKTVQPQSAGSGNLTGWNDNSTNAYNLGTAANTPSVVACGSSLAGEFVRSATDANTECVHGSGFTITSATAGGLWAVFALRSGASTSAFHELISIGNPSSTTRYLELSLIPNGGALYVGLFSRSATTNTTVATTSIGNTVSGTAWHSLLVTGDSVGASNSIYLDGVDVSADITLTGTPAGFWLSGWTTVLPTRIGLAVAVRNGTVTAGGDVKIFDAGFFHGTGDLTPLRGHLARKRMAAT